MDEPKILEIDLSPEALDKIDPDTQGRITEAMTKVILNVAHERYCQQRNQAGKA